MALVGNELLGLVFLAVAGALMLLMFYAWGFPYDKRTHRSSAPRAVVWTHRLLGYVYVAIYLYLMWDMVPRLWTYQVELPARTVAHLLLGMAIGAILVVKLTVVRFFKHMEASLVPLLGTGLFVCTLLLVGLALPVKLREAYLRDSALMGDTFSAERIERIREQLPKTGLDDPKLLDELATAEGLLAGRAVLINKCVQCHDLRTVLARPRTPDAWRQTVKRMADRSTTAVSAVSETEQWQVTAYLVAISPTLQRTLREKRKLDTMSAMAEQAAMMTGERLMAEEMDAASLDLASMRETFETKCSQCHPWQQVDAAPPGSKGEAVALVQRMTRNGLIASDEEIADIVRYLTARYVKPGTSAASSGASAAGPLGAVLKVNPAGEDLRFEQDTLTAKAGSRVRLVFNNTSGLEHNLVLVRTEEMPDEVLTASYAAIDKGFVPTHVAVLAAVPATSPGGSGEVEFEVPSPGKYRFACLFPGHTFTMKGTLISVE